MSDKLAATFHTGPHSDAAHRAITAELVACTLGQRSRPELRVDPAGVLTHHISRGLLAYRDGVRNLLGAFARRAR